MPGSGHASPIVWDDRVFTVSALPDTQDRLLLCLDRRTGKLLWRQTVLTAPLERKHGLNSFASSTPATDGELVYVASPVYSERCGLLLITGGFPDHHILAIRPDGAGNVTQTHIAWRTTRGVAYVPSPIIAGDYFLVIADSGVAHCFTARTGDLLWTERLGSQHAAIVSAEGRVYFLNDKGSTTVVQPGPQFRCVAQNDLGEKCFASPAISHGQLFLRGDRHLFCLGAGN